MKRSVIAIGLDAADPELFEKWLEEGKLPNLRALRDRGGYGRLTNLEYYKAETPWTTFLTGCLPSKVGYWTPVQLIEGTYDVREVQAYDFSEFPPFYALGEDFRVAAFDIPQSALNDRVNGLQVLAWGAHSPQTQSHSKPDGLLAEINARYGEHPALHRDHGAWWDAQYMGFLRDALKTGIQRRTAICRDLLAQERWDLFLTIYSELHSAGHDFWHMSNPNHQLHATGQTVFAKDPMLEVFQEVDASIGKVLEVAPDDATVIVFSVHGSDDNVTDAASMALLPEFLYRFSFPEKRGYFGSRRAKGTPPAMITGLAKHSWQNAVWERLNDGHPLQAMLKRLLPKRLHRRISRVLQPRLNGDLHSIKDLQKLGQAVSWQPAMWYSKQWPQMKAFAIPTFSEGYIRINLKGRDPGGIVAPEEYSSLCEQITSELKRLTNPRTGQPVVKKVIATRTSAADRDPRLPAADLVVVWDDQPADVVDHPVLGRIGPVPFRRTGSHRARGFYLVKGAEVTAGSTLPEGHAVDLTATIVALMGAEIPAYVDGQPLLSSERTSVNVAQG